MGPLFSKSSEKKHNGSGGKPRPVEKSTLSSKDQAILKLKVTRDKVEKLKKRNQTEAQLYVDKAKQCLKQGKKTQAKQALRLKRYKEKQVENLDNQLLGLVKMVNDIEWAETQSEVVKGLEAGNQALKRLNELLPVEEVERIMDENAEAVAHQEEINQLLSEGLDPSDESEIAAEYEEILKQEAKELASSLPSTKIELPDAPKTEVKASDVKVTTQEVNAEKEAVPA